MPADLKELKFNLVNVALDLGEIRCYFAVLRARRWVRERQEPFREPFLLLEHGGFCALQPRQAELELEFIEDGEG